MHIEFRKCEFLAGPFFFFNIGSEPKGNTLTYESADRAIKHGAKSKIIFHPPVSRICLVIVCIILYIVPFCVYLVKPISRLKRFAFCSQRKLWQFFVFLERSRPTTKYRFRIVPDLRYSRGRRR